METFCHCKISNKFFKIITDEFTETSLILINIYNYLNNSNILKYSLNENSIKIWENVVNNGWIWNSQKKNILYDIHIIECINIVNFYNCDNYSESDCDSNDTFINRDPSKSFFLENKYKLLFIDELKEKLAERRKRLNSN